MDQSFVVKVKDIYEFITINSGNIAAYSKGILDLKEVYSTVTDEEFAKQILDIITTTEKAIAISNPKDRDDSIALQYIKVKQFVKDYASCVLSELQSGLEKTNIEDFTIKSNDGYSLVLAGSFDQCYYHDVEVTFSDLQFIVCPGQFFSVGKFRFANEAEIDSISKITHGFEREGFVVCMEEAFGEAKYFIIANEVSVKWEKVLHY